MNDFEVVVRDVDGDINLEHVCSTALAVYLGADLGRAMEIMKHEGLLKEKGPFCTHLCIRLGRELKTKGVTTREFALRMVDIIDETYSYMEKHVKENISAVTMAKDIIDNLFTEKVN